MSSRNMQELDTLVTVNSTRVLLLGRRGSSDEIGVRETCARHGRGMLEERLHGDWEDLLLVDWTQGVFRMAAPFHGEEWSTDDERKKRARKSVWSGRQSVERRLDAVIDLGGYPGVTRRE
eukprot:CAMPEP_0118932926 /NCGR_PEP_ID=MMETSP1169-20130426/10694_1 /TAXON_ID=36882 /ORGANISM="Pyramimonas obovata, Strain CCMP722" /LENGTH=119 /DNA_ID=CAMNT_0006875633 /DNA_START=252 /DNA_END=611 /DNA_ORIENTATION=+